MYENVIIKLTHYFAQLINASKNSGWSPQKNKAFHFIFVASIVIPL
jgi:hypothetical protein